MVIFYISWKLKNTPFRQFLLNFRTKTFHGNYYHGEILHVIITMEIFCYEIDQEISKRCIFQLSWNEKNSHRKIETDELFSICDPQPFDWTHLSNYVTSMWNWGYLIQVKLWIFMEIEVFYCPATRDHHHYYSMHRSLQ